jgi:hypothetical protein
MKLKSFVLPLLVVTPFFAGALPAQEKEKPKELIALTPETAGLDFLVQGEYSGEITRGDQKEKYAAQVAAIGHGKFHAVFLPGGLPGEGWDGKSTLEIDGKTEGEKTTFAGKEFSAEIKGETLSGSWAPDAKFELKKAVRRSPTEGARAPEGAIVLFDGTNTDEWQSGKMDERNLLTALSGPVTRRKFKDFTLHLEFLQPFRPAARGQGRGNSGVYIQQRYEVQVLDSFGFKLTDKKPAGDLSAEIYKQKVPDISMNYPPLSWQTYDIDFQAAQFDTEGKKTKNAVVSVRHNGVTVHDKYEVMAKTGAGKAEGAEPGPIALQNHANPVFFRNIWIVEK